LYAAPSLVGAGRRESILYAFSPVTDRTDPYEIIGVRRDASLAEIRISYRRSTQILAPERFANASETVRAEAARRLTALNSAMEAIEAERAAESGSALGSLSFAGPAVSPAAEPSMRSTAVADEPPLPGTPGRMAEADQDGLVDMPEAPDASLPDPEEATAPVELEPEFPAVGHAPAAPGADAEDDLPSVTPGEDTSEVPLVELEPAPAAASAPAPPSFERERERGRQARPAKRERSLVPRMLAAAAVLAALAAVGIYFVLRGGSNPPAAGEFHGAGAPVSFSYPNDLVPRQPPSGGLLKPTFSTAVGVDAANYVVVATYRISANVQADGSAIGSGGSRLTADRFDQSVDRAAERIAAAQKLKAKGPAQPGKAGDLIARMYDYTRPGGSSARYAFAFRGHTEYSIACFWDPAHAQALTAACNQVMTTLQRQAT
jgi:hypothetical protein